MTKPKSKVDEDALHYDSPDEMPDDEQLQRKLAIARSAATSKDFEKAIDAICDVLEHVHGFEAPAPEAEPEEL